MMLFRLGKRGILSREDQFLSGAVEIIIRSQESFEICNDLWPRSLGLPSQVSCDLCDPTQQGLVLVLVVQMIGRLSSPDEVAVTAQEGNELRIEVAALVSPVVTIGAGSGAEHTAASVTFVDVFSDSIPAFGL